MWFIKEVKEELMLYSFLEWGLFIKTHRILKNSLLLNCHLKRRKQCSERNNWAEACKNTTFGRVKKIQISVVSHLIFSSQKHSISHKAKISLELNSTKPDPVLFPSLHCIFRMSISWFITSGKYSFCPFYMCLENNKWSKNYYKINYITQ